jgi:hypothetical protein
MLIMRKHSFHSQRIVLIVNAEVDASAVSGGADVAADECIEGEPEYAEYW